MYIYIYIYIEQLHAGMLAYTYRILRPGFLAAAPRVAGCAHMQCVMRECALRFERRASFIELHLERCMRSRRT